MIRALMYGRSGPWPHRGALRGAVDGLAWAGRVAADLGLAAAWDAARVVHAAVAQAPAVDRHRRLSHAWARVMAMPDIPDDDLSLLLVAWDADGAAVSGVGLADLYRVDDRAARWVPRGHPLFGPPGRPPTRPGALSVAGVPPLLVAVAHGDDVDLEGIGRDEVLARAGAS